MPKASELAGDLPKLSPLDIHRPMSFKMPKGQVKKLTLMWLGLVAFNLLLSMSSVEEVFNTSPSLTTQSEVCGGKYYTHKKNKEGSVLFAFLGSSASLQNDSKNKDLSLSVFELRFVKLQKKNLIQFKKSLTRIKRFSQESPRAPPLA